MTYLLTRASLEDLPEMIQWESDIFGSDAWSPELVVAEVSHPDNYYLVAKEGVGQPVVGYAGLRAPHRGGDFGDIQTLAVAPDHRGKGLGSLLMRALLDEAASRGVGTIFLEVRADNEVALGLYERVGFTTIDRRVGYYQPDGVDAVVMRLEGLSREPGFAVGRE
jgi:ribosomal-protein-alanine N-acetyltransferase